MKLGNVHKTIYLSISIATGSALMFFRSSAQPSYFLSSLTKYLVKMRVHRNVVVSSALKSEMTQMIYFCFSMKKVYVTTQDALFRFQDKYEALLEHYLILKQQTSYFLGREMRNFYVSTYIGILIDNKKMNKWFFYPSSPSGIRNEGKFLLAIVIL